MADIPKLDLESKDIAADKRAKLKALFPEVFTEGDQIDFDKLRLTLGDSIDANDERFGLHWAGKKECFSIIQEPSIGTLKPAKDESVNWDDTENLFIEGDNLEVLKLLQKSYYGKVKMIYIDPPYNTGKEFIYPDKYQENLDTYLAYTGQVDDDGYKFSTNVETEGRYHSNWLNMMYPRLFLARNLLRDDGVIFISIDDNEVDNLKKLCSEIFGEENFVAQVEWQKRYTRSNNTNNFTSVIEHILIYQKSDAFNVNLLERDREANARFTNPDNDLRGVWKATPFLNQVAPEKRPNLCYPIENPFTGTITNPTKKAWRYERSVFDKLLEENRLWWGKNKDKKIPDIKTFLSEVRAGMTPINFWSHKYAGNTDEANREIKELFEEKIFDTPKPTKLIKRMLEHSCQTDGEIVLDFFAGSGATAQSVISKTTSEGKKFRFILVQLPEPVKSEFVGYGNISDLSKERIRRVIQKMKSEKESFITELQSKETVLAELEAQKAKTPELFKNGKPKDLANLETSIEELKTKIANIESTDLGFKVFKLDRSNFKVWDGAVENDVPRQIEMAINHLEPDSKELDILYEILLKAGFELTLPIKELSLADKKVYSIEDDALLICLEGELNEAVIRAIAAKEPARVVCLDSSFKDNDQLKTNAVQIMKSHKVHDFKTV